MFSYFFWYNTTMPSTVYFKDAQNLFDFLVTDNIPVKSTVFGGIKLIQKICFG